MGKDVPCYQCDNRTETCHSSCQLYIDWSNKRAKERESKFNSIEHVLNQYESSRNSRLRKIKRYK